MKNKNRGGRGAYGPKWELWWWCCIVYWRLAAARREVQNSESIEDGFDSTQICSIRFDQVLKLSSLIDFKFQISDRKSTNF